MPGGGSGRSGRGGKTRHLDAPSSAESSDEDLKKALELSLVNVSSEDEDTKQAIELSKSAIYIDSDDDVKQAIELSLMSQTSSPIYISDDEFDSMCQGPSLSLKQRASQSSLSSEDGKKDIRVVDCLTGERGHQVLTADMTLLDVGLGANCVVGSGTNHTWLEANYDFESGIWNEYLNGDVSGGKAWSAWTQSDWDVTLDHNYFKVSSRPEMGSNSSKNANKAAPKLERGRGRGRASATAVSHMTAPTGASATSVNHVATPSRASSTAVSRVVAPSQPSATAVSNVNILAAAPSQTAVNSSGAPARAGATINAASRRMEDWTPEPEDDYEEQESEFSRTCGTLLSMNGLDQRHNHLRATHPHGYRLTSDEATKRMRGVFAKGLEAKLNAEEMEPCKAIVTKLHPHQKSGLAWMMKHEQKENQGMNGGILADDMGLGKTLTMIALILTNHHDGRPLAKPNIGYIRPKIEIGRKGKGKGKKKILFEAPVVSNVGRKIKAAAPVAKRSAVGFFDNFKSSSDDDEEEDKDKFTFGEAAKNYKPKNSRPRRSLRKSSDEEEEDEEDEDDAAFINDNESSDEEDEFDQMEKESSSLSSRLKVSTSKSHEEVRDPRDKELDDLYDEWQNLSQEEKDKKVKSLSSTSVGALDPALNMDGAWDSSSDEESISLKKKTKNNVFSSSDEEEEAPKVGVKRANSPLDEEPRKKMKPIDDSGSDSEINLSDIDLDDVSPVRPSKAVSTIGGAGAGSFNKGEKPKSSVKLSYTDFELPDLEDDAPSCSRAPVKTGKPSTSVDQPKPSTSALPGVKRIIPPREPASRGRRPRPTLVVCPTSLLSHWCAEIDNHVDRSVELKVKVHHGQHKAKLGADLNQFDVVITTYGTLANELNADTSPLLRATWLRVVLDEGHFIKNHNSKTAKAANLLNSKRRWVVTGTPIQNNLTELWSLVNWLQFDLYAGSLRDFKNQIERPCKNREESGFERLQTLMDAICLRRTKNDKKPNGDPIVPLPTKTVVIREVTFTEDEKLCYTILQKEAMDIVLRYQKRGVLMKNYAHIFALMMRLRQFCCHRELIRQIDWTQTLRDKAALQRELVKFLEQEGTGGAEEEAGGASDGDQAKRLAAQLRDMIRTGVTDDCSICLDDLKSPVITPCSHVYCRPCIERVIETVKPPICPLCRGAVSKKDLLEAGDEEEEEAEKDEILKKLDSIEFNDSSSKVNAAIKEMLRIREADPDDKIIVVSQFTSFLSMFQPLLTENGFKFVRLDGTMSHMDRTDVVTLFQKQTASSPKVLLLSLKAGGVGLNLTAANHILLLDPAWNPAAEWQCFDRAHRIGQKKDVNIYKFITVGETVEEKMLQIQAKKEELISGAFHMPDEERRRQRVNDILTIFNIVPMQQNPPQPHLNPPQPQLNPPQPQLNPPQPQLNPPQPQLNPPQPQLN